MTRTPLWKSIADTLTREIAQGQYGPGDKLPTESRLAERFGVNRHTVRHALATMVEEGLVFTRRGAGAFIVQRPAEYPIGRRVRYTANLAAAGRIPGRRARLLERRAASAREAEALRIATGDPVQVYEGESLADDQPIALFRSVFPAARLPDILDHLRATPSVTEALRRSGVPDYLRASTRLCARLADAAQAALLRIEEGDPLLRSDAVNIDLQGVPVEFGRAWFAGARVTLTVQNDAGEAFNPEPVHSAQETPRR